MYQPTPLEVAYGMYLLENVFQVNTSSPHIVMKVPGRSAVPFLSQSELPRNVLRNIWSTVDPDNSGSLVTPYQFYAILRMVALGQNGLVPDLATLNQNHSGVPLARFQGYPVPDEVTLQQFYYQRQQGATGGGVSGAQDSATQIPDVPPSQETIAPSTTVPPASQPTPSLVSIEDAFGALVEVEDAPMPTLESFAPPPESPNAADPSVAVGSDGNITVDLDPLVDSGRIVSSTSLDDEALDSSNGPNDTRHPQTEEEDGDDFGNFSSAPPSAPSSGNFAALDSLADMVDAPVPSLDSSRPVVTQAQPAVDLVDGPHMQNSGSPTQVEGDVQDDGFGDFDSAPVSTSSLPVAGNDHNISINTETNSIADNSIITGGTDPSPPEQSGATTGTSTMAVGGEWGAFDLLGSIEDAPLPALQPSFVPEEPSPDLLGDNDPDGTEGTDAFGDFQATPTPSSDTVDAPPMDTDFATVNNNVVPSEDEQAQIVGDDIATAANAGEVATQSTYQENGTTTDMFAEDPPVFQGAQLLAANEFGGFSSGVPTDTTEKNEISEYSEFGDFQGLENTVESQPGAGEAQAEKSLDNADFLGVSVDITPALDRRAAPVQAEESTSSQFGDFLGPPASVNSTTIPEVAASTTDEWGALGETPSSKEGTPIVVKAEESREADFGDFLGPVSEEEKTQAHNSDAFSARTESEDDKPAGVEDYAFEDFTKNSTLPSKTVPECEETKVEESTNTEFGDFLGSSPIEISGPLIGGTGEATKVGQSISSDFGDFFDPVSTGTNTQSTNTLDSGASGVTGVAQVEESTNPGALDGNINSSTPRGFLDKHDSVQATELVVDDEKIKSPPDGHRIDDEFDSLGGSRYQPEWGFAQESSHTKGNNEAIGAENNTSVENNAIEFGDFGCFEGVEPLSNAQPIGSSEFGPPKAEVSDSRSTENSDFGDFHQIEMNPELKHEACPTETRFDAFSDNSANNKNIASDNISKPTRKQLQDEFVLRIGALPPCARCILQDSKDSQIDFKAIFDRNVGAGPIKESDVDRLNKSQMLIDCIASSHRDTRDMYWEKVFSIVTEDTKQAHDILQESLNLDEESRKSIRDRLRMYVLQIAEMVRVTRNISATIADILLVEPLSVLSDATLEPSWGSLRIACKALDTEKAWKHLQDLALQHGIVDPEEFQHFPSLVSIRSRRTEHVGSTQTKRCFCTLQPLYPEDGNPQTTSAVKWKGNFYMACAANFLVNRIGISELSAMSR